MTTKQEQCCDEPRGFVGGVCDHCGGEVQHEFTHLELEQQVSEWRQKAYKLERDALEAALCTMLFHARKLEREQNMLASALRDVMNSSDSTSMYRTAKDALNKLTEQES